MSASGKQKTLFSYFTKSPATPKPIDEKSGSLAVSSVNGIETPKRKLLSSSKLL